MNNYCEISFNFFFFSPPQFPSRWAWNSGASGKDCQKERSLAKLHWNWLLQYLYTTHNSEKYFWKSWLVNFFLFSFFSFSFYFLFLSFFFLSLSLSSLSLFSLFFFLFYFLFLFFFFFFIFYFFLFFIFFFQQQKNFINLILFTQPLHSGRIWHKVNFF